MKTGTIFVLVAFITMGLEMACAQRPFRGKVLTGGSPMRAEMAQSPTSDLGVVVHSSRCCAHCRMEIWHSSDSFS